MSARVRVPASWLARRSSLAQDYQSEIVFHSALLVGQLSPITRIASGCAPEDQARLRARYALLYPPRFGVHFTPDFKKDEATGKTYHFYNKPRGMLDFLQARVVEFPPTPAQWLTG